VTRASQNVMDAWERAYEAHPQLASEFVFDHVATLLETYPGERVYEVGFGSGRNLSWAREHGWEVAGCEVAETAFQTARAVLPGADLRKESIVDCSAPSDYYDIVVDRAALSSLSPKDLKAAFFHIRRILKPNGLFLFNPYSVGHTKAFPEQMPAQTKWEPRAARRLFPDTKWELVDFQNLFVKYQGDDTDAVEHTLRILVRKTV
jgi:SAM-dependent methyltransferase